MAERVEAEITLGFREFVSGVDTVIRETGRMGQGVEKGLNQTEQAAHAVFAEFAKSSRIAGAEYQQFAKKVSEAANSISLGDIEKRLSGMAQKGAAAFGSILESGGNFQEGLLRINTIAGLSQDELAALGDQLKNVGREIKVSATPTQTLATYYEVLSSGFTKTSDATRVLQASLKLASGGQADAADTTRALTGVLNAYGDSSEKAQLRADQFFQTVNLGVTTVPELSKSLGLVTSTAASAGVSFEELSAAIATATLRGQTTSAAIEGIRGVIGSIISPTKGAEKEFARLGITINASTLQQKGLLATLQEIRNASGGQIDSINKIIEGQVGLATALALSKDGGAAFARNLDQIAGSAGASDKALAQVNKGVNESSKAFAASVERLKISAADAALPIQKTLLEALTSVVDTLDKAPQGLKTAALALTGLGTAIAFAGSAAIGVSLALPIVTGQLVGLATRGLPLAIAAAKLLTAELTLQNVQMGLVSLRAGLAGRATAAFATAQAAAGTAMSGIVAAISGVTLGFAAVAAAVGLAIAAYTKLQQEANASNEAILKSEDLRKNGRQVKGNASLSNTDLLASTAQDLAKRGVTTDDITQRILDQEKAAEQARELQNAEQERKAKERLKRLRVLRSELASELLRLDAEAKKPPVIKEQTDEKEERKAKREADKLRREQVAEGVQDIENSKRTNEQKIQGLQQLITEFQLVGRERRAIEDKIFELEKKNQTERSKAAETERKEKILDAVQEIENSRQSNQEKIKGLQDVLRQYKVNAAERRSIEDKITALERKDTQEQAKAKRDATRKAAKEAKEEAAKEKKETKAEVDVLGGQRDALRTESDLAKKRQDILADLAAAGAATEFEIKDAAEQSLKIRLQEIEVERQLAVQQAKTSEEIAAADKRAAVQRAEAQADTERAIQKTTDAMKAQKREGSKATNLDLGGNVQSLADFVAGQQGFLDITKPDKKKIDPKEAARQRSILNAINSGPNLKDAKRAESDSVASAAAKAAKSLLQLDIQLFGQDGEKIPIKVKKAVVDGNNTEVSQLTRNM